tara:strand:+ start:140 stop:1288 length:1149 start_codon:yes stop_codon:yes gene_type:complete
MFHSFKNYLVEEDRAVYFGFGRMNPPTIGHGKVLDKLSSLAGSNPYRMYLSQSQDAKKNPLAYKEKVKISRKMFPKHARSIIMAPKLRNAMEIASALYKEGFVKVVMVVGQDRLREFDVLLNKYNGKKARHGFYNFQDIKVISAGQRDPDAEGVEGMSASKMRKAAADNEYANFVLGLPKTYGDKDSKKLFNTIRNSMGLKETKVFHSHIKLESISETREAYVSGDLYGVDDKVVIKETEEVGTVKYCASNYLVVELHTGQQVRKWLDAVELVEKSTQEEYKYEWGKDDGVKWMKKLTPGEGKKDKHSTFKSFKEADKEIDFDASRSRGNEKSYTGTSQHVSRVDTVKKKIQKRKERNVKMNDRMMDRARSTDTRRKNKGIG